MNFASKILTAGFVISALELSACSDDIVIPDPVAMTRDSVGYYCNMIIADHPGPKAQVFEAGVETPFWFTQVRDALFYKTLPGEGTRILEVYVQDSAAITDWNNPPQDGPWVRIAEATYVIGSSRRGGMGARETVSFGSRQAAEEFRAEYGGRIVTFSEMPENYLTGDEGEYSHTSDAALNQSGYGSGTL